MFEIIEESREENRTSVNNESQYELREIDIHNAQIEPNNRFNPTIDIFDTNTSGNNQINIEHSSDVVIGNVAQFHGPVTIIQNNSQLRTENESISQNQQNNATLVTPDSSSKSTDCNGSLTPIKNQSNLCLKTVSVILFICISTVLVFYLYDKLTTIPESNTSATGSHRIILRTKWGGRPPIYTRKIYQPTMYVIISHTVTEQCKSVKTCSNIVLNIQSAHVAQYNSPDIGYNFLVGGDENVYVGRGWDAENFHMENSIGISFIGNYIYDRLTPGMVEVTQQLLNEGRKLGKLDKNYKLIAHNQTYNTLSPGPNVYDSIRFWPHYSSELVTIVP